MFNEDDAAWQMMEKLKNEDNVSEIHVFTILWVKMHHEKTCFMHKISVLMLWLI